MDLKARLGRLAARRGGAAPLLVPESPEAPETPASAAPPHIAALRSRLAEMLERTQVRGVHKQVEREAARAARLSYEHAELGGILPFETHEQADGPLHVRVVRHGPSARVGRVEFAPARSASASALSLLALDAKLAEVDFSRALYLDTESTGLAGGTGTIPFLVGLAWFEGDELVVEQLLLRQLGEEGPLLARFAERVAAASCLVSFNGKSFDLPLLRTRFVMNRRVPPPEPPHLDLVHVARRVHRLGPRSQTEKPAGPWIEREADDGVRRTLSCKLISLERHLLAFEREGDIPSGEIPARYAHFLRTGESEAIAAVCDHNLWDVVSMVALVATYADAVVALDHESHEARARESCETLTSRDLVGVARTLGRAGDLTRARSAAGVALADADDDAELALLARRVRAHIAKRARDVDGAVVDFEALAREHDDADARLELAKIYEHKLRDPASALACVAAGTSEPEAASEHRRARLARKALGANTAQLTLLGKSRRRD